jgi:ribosomal protein L11 methyltransferase
MEEGIAAISVCLHRIGHFGRVCMTASIIELSLLSTPAGSDSLLQDLHQWGIHDCIEASCDFLDSDEADAAEILARFESGEMNLPVLVYSYDERFIDELMEKLRHRHGDSLQIQTRRIRDELWQNAWQPGFRFLESERFLIGPADLLPPSHAKIPIRLQSGTVFGSGQHATTQAMVRLMEQMPAPSANGRFLDIGTGTGVLLFVAAHLGFRELAGTDIEEEAIAIARENAEQNPINQGVELQLHAQSLPPAGASWGTIACNILPPTLTHLLPELAARLDEEGRLLLAGFHEANAKDIGQALENLSMAVEAEVKERGWIAWCCKKI